LKAAYGIDIPAPYPNTATNRRDSYSKRLESQGRNGEGAVGPAADTLLTWENEVLPELAEVLIAAATGETPGIRLLPEALPERRTRTAVNDATYLFSSAGVVQEGYVVREIEALRDSVSEVEVSHSYINDPRPGVLRIQPYTNCDLIRTRFTPAGYLHARLRIPSLPREKRTRISYRLLVTSQVPCRPLIKVTPRTYEDRAIIRLQFHSDYLPHHLWRLNSPSDIETPELPSSGNLLGLSTTGYLELTLFDLVPGLSEGVSWKWPEDRP
jgi:hypothetical protein